MTIREILHALEPFKPMTAPGLYIHLKALKIKPLGARQIPQNYPDDTADRLLVRLGFKQPANGRTRSRRRAHRQLQKEAA